LTGRVAALNRFIPRAAKRSLPFFQVLRSAKNFQWSETQKQAFQELKDYLSKNFEGHRIRVITNQSLNDLFANREAST
jgi:hypothetical protein